MTNELSNNERSSKAKHHYQISIFMNTRRPTYHELEESMRTLTEKTDMPVVRKE